MTDRHKQIIIAEATFIEDLICKIYVGQEEFTNVNWISLKKRCELIKNIVKEDRS